MYMDDGAERLEGCQFLGYSTVRLVRLRPSRPQYISKVEIRCLTYWLSMISAEQECAGDSKLRNGLAATVSPRCPFSNLRRTHAY